MAGTQSKHNSELSKPRENKFAIMKWMVQVLQPQNLPISEVLKSSGRDPEKEVYRLLMLLRCKPFLEAYIADMKLPHKMGPEQKFPIGLSGFHTLYPGMDFR